MNLNDKATRACLLHENFWVSNTIVISKMFFYMTIYDLNYIGQSNKQTKKNEIK